MKLRTRVILGAVVAALLAGVAGAADEPGLAEVRKAIAALNEAFEKGDADAVGRLLTDDHVGVTSYYGGPQKKAEQMASLPDLKLSAYTAGAMRVSLLGKDVALVSYPLTLKGTYKGKEVPRRNFASAVWVKRGGRWKEAFYQETALEEK